MLSSHGMQPDEVVQKGADFNTVALATSPSSDHQLDFFFCPCVSLLYQQASGEKNVRLTRRPENKDIHYFERCLPLSKMSICRKCFSV